VSHTCCLASDTNISWLAGWNLAHYQHSLCFICNRSKLSS
jgi:hypothetical protein